MTPTPTFYRAARFRRPALPRRTFWSWPRSREGRIALIAIAALLVLLGHAFANERGDAYRLRLDHSVRTPASRTAAPDADAPPGQEDRSPGLSFLRSGLFKAFLLCLILPALAICWRFFVELLEDERDEGRVVEGHRRAAR